jgi:hypothetical protein
MVRCSRHMEILAAVFVLVGAAVIVGYVLLGWLGAIVLFLVAGAGAVLGAWMFLLRGHRPLAEAVRDGACERMRYGRHML